MNRVLTFLLDCEARPGWLITQALGRARAFILLAFTNARALFVWTTKQMDEAQRLLMERYYERRMAVRAMFLNNPRDISSGFTTMGRKVLAYWSKQAHALAPLQTTDPITMAKAEGKRELLAIILSDLFDDLPDFAQLMAMEEARAREEMIA